MSEFEKNEQLAKVDNLVGLDRLMLDVANSEPIDSEVVMKLLMLRKEYLLNRDEMVTMEKYDELECELEDLRAENSILRDVIDGSMSLEEAGIE